MVHTTGGSAIMILFAAVKVLIFLMGGLITYFAFKAYRRTGSRSLGLLATGFALVTVGAMLGGVVYELLQVDLAVGVVIEGVFVLLGFSLIAYSLRGE